MKKNNIFNFFHKFFVPISIFVLGIVIYFIFNIGSQLVFLEYENSSKEISVDSFSMSENKKIEQDFTMPYPLFSGINIKIGTEGIDNNSILLVKILNKDTGKELYSWTKNATAFIGQEKFLFETNHPLAVSTSEVYTFTIECLSGVNSSGIQIFANELSGENFVMKSNLPNSYVVDFSIYGGNKDTLTPSVYFIFIGFIIIISTIFIVKSIPFKGNAYVEAIILGVACFVVMSFYIKSNLRFSDEYDNATAGLVMKNGHVLYKQYVSQHPPATMFLSALFALLGAESIPQFRLLYYIILAFGWAYIYFRNRDDFGRIGLVILAIVSSTFIFVYNEGYYFLGDGISGICMTVLFFEFLKYAKTSEIDLVMSISISISIYFSFASNFLMIYPIFMLVLGFLFVEIKKIKAEKNINIHFFVKRYLKFVIILLIPFICTFCYFYFNNALTDMIDQVYLFNTEVYPYYQNGFGENKITVFLDCLNKFIKIPSVMISSIFLGENIFVSLIFLGLFLSVIFVTYKLLQDNKKIIGLFFATFNILMLVRSTESLNGFHGIGANYILFSSLITGLYLIKLSSQKIKKMIHLFALACFLISNIYLSAIVTIVNDSPQPISASQKFVIENLDSEDSLFVDYFITDSTYFIYKGYLPINRTPYILPWYQDWYESWSMEDINNYHPKIIIYNEDMDVWGHTHFSEQLSNKIRIEYTEVQENIWIRN